MRWSACLLCLVCADAGQSDIDAILAGIPAQFRPQRVAVELDARTQRIEAHPERGSIALSPRLRGLDRSVWLHEIAHLAAAGPRPETPAARRLARAIDEAVADYYAAALAGDPVVGGARDLSAPPVLRAEAWAMLGLPGFDSHLLGWRLAALWWRIEPLPGPLLEDLLSCLAGDALARAHTPADVLHALAASCPARSRARIARTLRAWAPAELFGDSA